MSILEFANEVLKYNDGPGSVYIGEEDNMLAVFTTEDTADLTSDIEYSNATHASLKDKLDQMGFSILDTHKEWMEQRQEWYEMGGGMPLDEEEDDD